MECERCGSERDYGCLVCDECQRADAYWDSPMTIPCPEPDTDLQLEAPSPRDWATTALVVGAALIGAIVATLAWIQPVAMLAGF